MCPSAGDNSHVRLNTSMGPAVNLELPRLPALVRKGANTPLQGSRTGGEMDFKCWLGECGFPFLVLHILCICSCNAYFKYYKYFDSRLIEFRVI